MQMEQKPNTYIKPHFCINKVGKWKLQNSKHMNSMNTNWNYFKLN